MSRQKPGRQVYAPYRAAIKKNKKGSAVKWIVWSALSLLVLGGIIFVVSLTLSAINKSLVAYDPRVPGAMNDSALKVLARELNFGNETELQVYVPVSYQDAVDNMDFRPRETFLEPYDQKRKRITAEWLYGREMDESFHKPIAQSLAEAYHTNTVSFDRELQLSLMRAFQRWGHQDFVHLLVSPTASDKVVPTMLELAERYPTVSGTETAATFLKGKYGDIAERIVKNSAEKNAKLLVPYYDSKDVVVSDRVKRVYNEWGIDVNQARVDYYLSRAAGGDDTAWEMVANIPVQKDMQPQVIDALRRYKRSRLGVDNWLDACYQWGDEAVLSMVQEVYLSGWTFDKKKAMRIMVKYPDESSVDVLVDALLESWATQSQQISRALRQLEEAGLEIDYAERMHKPLVRQYNNFGMFQKPAMKTLLDSTNFDYNLLVDQCIKDLRLRDKSSQAFETLSKMEVIEKRRYGVAKAIQEIIEAGGISGFNTEECFLHWATADNSYIYEILGTDNFGGDNWRKALRIALQGEDHLQKVVVPVARAFGDFFKGDQVIDVLVEQGESVEDLMLLMLKSDNPKEIVGACKVLQVIGTEKSIPELQRIFNKARRIGHEDVYYAAQMAGQIVSEKVERQKQGETTDDDGDDDG